MHKLCGLVYLRLQCIKSFSSIKSVRLPGSKSFASNGNNHYGRWTFVLITQVLCDLQNHCGIQRAEEQQGLFLEGTCGHLMLLAAAPGSK